MVQDPVKMEFTVHNWNELHEAIQVAEAGDEIWIEDEDLLMKTVVKEGQPEPR